MRKVPYSFCYNQTSVFVTKLSIKLTKSNDDVESSNPSKRNTYTTITIVLSVAIISIDDANITNSKHVEKRANKRRTGAHNVMSNKECDAYKSHNEVLPRNKDGERKHKGKERNDLEESGCTEKREWHGLNRENYKRAQSQTLLWRGNKLNNGRSRAWRRRTKGCGNPKFVLTITF